MCSDSHHTAVPIRCFSKAKTKIFVNGNPKFHLYIIMLDIIHCVRYI
jgi:hypothetical protein